MTDEAALTDDDLPALFRLADRQAIRSQRRYYLQVRVQLAMLIIGSIAGVTVQVTDVSELAFVGVAAYLVLVVIRVQLKVGSTDKVWYENRLIAESVKSLAWRYAVGGAPFGLDAGEGVAVDDELFRERMAGVLTDVTHVPLPDPEHGTEQITEGMRQLRAAPREARIRAYEAERMGPQLRWYADRAALQRTWAARLDATMLGASGVAVFFGLLQALGAIDVNLLGLAGIVAAVVATWTATTHYGKQADAYALAAHQLMLAQTMIAHQDDEPKWQAFVNDAEDGISREHTSWRVTRAQK